LSAIAKKRKASVVSRLDKAMGENPSTNVPDIKSFEQFLMEHAEVRKPDGTFVRYSLDGREPLLWAVRVIDHVLGSHTGKVLKDAKLSICGGAQIGKTIIECNLMAYAGGVLFMNVGLYLPDDKLVDGIVDGKFRPDVIERVDFLGPLMTLGKGKDKRGRLVNRKGAVMFKDSGRVSECMVMGLNKVPTSFSMSIAIEDEKDDIQAKFSKYLEGRMGASDLRFRISIGTQRLHGMGQNREWQDGSQGVAMFDVGDGKLIRPEEFWPQVCRLQLGAAPHASDPMLTYVGDFQRGEDPRIEKFPYKPGQTYYLADPETGVVIDRTKPIEKHLRPERIEMYDWSYSFAHLGMSAYGLDQTVARWQKAVKDPVTMVAFRCEVLALPMNTTQGLSPEILARSRAAGPPFDTSLSLRPGSNGYGGLDTGNTCWFVAREVMSEVEKRIIHAEDIPLGGVVKRAVTLFHKIGLTALFIDARPAVNEARQITYALNGLEGIKWPVVPDPDNKKIVFPGGLEWDGEKGVWINLRCAVVEFTRKPGTGIVQKIGQDQADGITKFFPIIQCSRFDTIDRAIAEFQTPAENIYRTYDGEVYQEPVMLLPRQVDGSPKIIETLDHHLITGSARVEVDGEKGDYVDKCDNHLLLADAYSGVAEHLVLGTAEKAACGGYEAVEEMRPEARRIGGGL
jgi:hypothetical protein